MTANYLDAATGKTVFSVNENVVLRGKVQSITVDASGRRFVTLEDVAEAKKVFLKDNVVIYGRGNDFVSQQAGVVACDQSINECKVLVKFFGQKYDNHVNVSDLNLATQEEIDTANKKIAEEQKKERLGRLRSVLNDVPKDEIPSMISEMVTVLTANAKKD